MDDIITKRLHISGLTPAITVSDLQKRLSTFGEVKSLDGFGLLDGVGNPRKFGYVDLQTTKAKLARCLNLLSGSTWKGAKLRIGEAKPDYRQRFAEERAQAEAIESRPKKRRRVQAVEARDMSLVTPENVQHRPGWKVTQTGRIIRPMKMRPLRPLGPTLDEINVRSKSAATSKKRKRERALDTRARRRVIDPLQWGSTQLRGIFLESHGASIIDNAKAPEDPRSMDSSPESDSELEETKSTTLEKTASPMTNEDKHIPPTSSSPRAVTPHETNNIQATGDILEEKDRTISFLNSLFAGDDWGGQESLSDVEDDGVRPTAVSGDNNEIEEVPMDTAVNEEAVSTTDTASKPVAQMETRTLKDLFAPKQSDGGFSLLGQLDLEIELDEEVPFGFESAENPPDPQPNSIPTISPVAIPADQGFTFTLDAKAPLFFPLPSSFTPSESAGSGKQRDLFDVAREGGWDWRIFHRTESEAEIRAKWGNDKGELTRMWKKRWREAGKARKRGGGGHDD